MSRSIISLFCILFSLGLNGQNLEGAWETILTSEDGEKLKNIVIFADGYHVSTTFHATNGEFINTKGGSWKLEGDRLTVKIEFHTDKTELIGTEVSRRVKTTSKRLALPEEGIEFNRIDKGKPGKLEGAWLMSGRVRDGKTQIRNTNRPRKTMKILSGTRFQWIAYNTETKEFKGTGGGTYTTIDNKYTENIEFFSRDNSRVGISLNFNYKLMEGNWHHSGLSSKGAPIHEIWSKRE